MWYDAESGGALLIGFKTERKQPILAAMLISRLETALELQMPGMELSRLIWPVWSDLKYYDSEGESNEGKLHLNCRKLKNRSYDYAAFELQFRGSIHLRYGTFLH